MKEGDFVAGTVARDSSQEGSGGDFFVNFGDKVVESAEGSGDFVVNFGDEVVESASAVQQSLKRKRTKFESLQQRFLARLNQAALKELMMPPQGRWCSAPAAVTF